MYSAKINGEPTTFGTSGLLFRSNKLMYDRVTETIWHQFTGEPVIGPLAGEHPRLTFHPSILTTWAEWLEDHPDTTVISNETGLYPSNFYVEESNPEAIYYDYFNDPETMFPIWNRDDSLETKSRVAGLEIDGVFKAYPLDLLQQDRVVNDAVADVDVVVIGSPGSFAAQVYERNGLTFALASEDESGLPATLVDDTGVVWNVSNEYLISSDDSTNRLPRIPTLTSFWFGWFAFHPETELYTGP